VTPRGVTAPPVVVDPTSRLSEAPSGVEVALGDASICARVGGYVYCARDDAEPLTTTAPVGGISDAVALAAGSRFACVLARSGKVRCLGDNHHGQLGAGSREESSAEPLDVQGVHGATRIAAGRRHACALLEGGAVRCWGANLGGETGGSAAFAPEVRELALPTAVTIPPATAIAASADATCALTMAGLHCWGAAVMPAQQRAIGSQSERPWRAPAPKDLEDLTAGEGVFCGLRAGAALCWGSSYSIFPDVRGALREPLAVKLPPVRRVRVAESHACALSTSGAVLCWGNNYAHALGRETGEDNSDSFGPEVVAGLPPAVDVAVGGGLSCATAAGGEVYCWGTWPSIATRRGASPARLRL
jgi:alpha-tubulin suppressor-like RCC1 family protein